MAPRKIHTEFILHWYGDSRTTSPLSVQAIFLALTLIQVLLTLVTLRKLPQKKEAYRVCLLALSWGCGYLAVAYLFSMGLTAIYDRDSLLAGEMVDYGVGFFVAEDICYVIAMHLIFISILVITYRRATEYGAKEQKFWKVKNLADRFLVTFRTVLAFLLLGLDTWAIFAYYHNRSIQWQDFRQVMAHSNKLNITGDIIYVIICMSTCAGILKLYLQAKHAATVDKMITISTFGLCPAVVISALDTIIYIIVDILQPKKDLEPYYLLQLLITGLALFMIITFSIRLYEEEPSAKTDSDPPGYSSEGEDNFVEKHSSYPL